jgi:hypothetical protein
VSVWFEVRLFDLDRFESLRSDLEALIGGEVRPSVRAAAVEGLARLAHGDAFGGDVLREHYAEPLRAIAHGQGAIADRRAVPSITPLLMTVCMLDYEEVDYAEEAAPPQNLVQLGDQDGGLYAELTARSRWIHDLMNGIVTAWWPENLPEPEPPDFDECQHRALLVLSRVHVATLGDELDRLAGDPRWLKDLSRDRVRPEHAAPAFTRLRALVGRARGDAGWSVCVEVSG